MRNLKKLMAVVLAVVMVFALASVASAVGYADITDKSDITNTEAVSLLVDLGIINGIKQADGTTAYKPNDIVDRATMAKLISYVKIGDVDGSLFQGTATDLTDIDTSWAEGYIKYCYSTGIISGDGAGHFFPTTTVNVVAAAKMLLVALGYDATDRGYVNSASWSVNVMKDAQSAGLLDGLSVKASDGLTRDNAAQMIYNALFAKTVTLEYTYDMGVKYVSKIVKSETTLGEENYDGLQKVTAVVLEYGDDTTLTESSSFFTDSDHTVADADTLAGATYADLASTENNLGKLVDLYVDYDGEVLSTAVANSSKNDVYTLKTGLTDDEEDTKTTDGSVTEWLYDNGIELSGEAVDISIEDYTASTTATLAKGDLVVGNATIAYVVDFNNDDVIDSFVSTTKTVAKVTSAVKTKTVDGDLKVYIPGVTGGYVDCVGYEGVAKNDYVMYIEHDDTYYVTECDTFTGVLTGYKGTSTVYVDGTAYTISSIGLMSQAEVLALDTDYEDDITFYTDANGNIVFAKLVEDDSTVNAAILLGYEETESSVDDSAVATARLLFADGITKTVTVSEINGLANTVDVPEFDTYGTLNKTDANDATEGVDTVLGENYAMVIYEIDSDGEYELNVVGTLATVTGTDDSDYTVGTLTEAALTSGKAVFATGFIGDSTTVFMVAKYSDSTGKLTSVTVYTGIANAPEYVAGASGANGAVISCDGVASVVFLNGGSVTDTGDDTEFVYFEADPTAIYTAASKTYKVEAFVDGVETTFEVKKAIWEAATQDEDMLYKATLNDDGVVYKLEDATGSEIYKDTGTGVKFANDILNVDTAGSTTYWTFNDDSEIYLVNEDGDTVTQITAADITKDSNDVVYVYASTSHTSDLIADTVYIFAVEDVI